MTGVQTCALPIFPAGPGAAIVASRVGSHDRTGAGWGSSLELGRVSWFIMFRCSKYQKQFSPYLDRFLPAAERLAVEEHLQECADCSGDLRQLARWNGVLKQLPSPAMPPDLLFQIRNRIGCEQGRKNRPTWVWRWASQVRPFVLPVTSGIACALLFFGTLVPLFSNRPLASSTDVPLALTTPPRFRGSAPLELNADTKHLVVALLVDEQGRVADYHILAGSPTAQDLRNLRNTLLFTVFDPATSFGRPRPEQIVVSFQSLQVRG